ncbi:MAG: peptidoglycan-associated lipoprotein Pal [Candidatus Rokuibacteriota bacterium]
MRRLAVLVAGLALAVSGCATLMPERPRAAPAGTDVTGRWSGIWYGHGIAGIPREQDAIAEFEQRGAGGRGVITFDGALAVEALPVAARTAGLAGSRVLLEVAGSNLVLIHELGPRHLKAQFRVDGDRMVGHITDADPPVRIVMEREKPEPPKPAAAPPPPAPPQVAAPPPPPAVEPTPTPPPPPAVAMAPTPGSEPTPSSEAKPESTPRPAPEEFVEAPELKAVHFDFDKATIRPEDVALLDENAEWLKGNELLVLIEGHADERGTNEYNLALGERRAKAVRDHLVTKGVAADRINTVSYGEERPACTEKNAACWKDNRRAKSLVRRQ